MRDKIHKLIVDAVVVDRTLKEPFSAHDVRRICPGWGFPRYYSYLAANCAENCKEESALYMRVGRGRYVLNKVAGLNNQK